MRRSCVWSLLLCLLGSFVCQAAEPVAPPTKLAVVDVGPQEKVPPAFLDLMLVGLGNQPQLALLERTELAKLLREQALSLRMGEPVKSADAVKAGQLWAVDAFLMLEAGKPSDKKEIPVRVRLVDAHYGLKLWDGSILVSPDTTKYQESIDLVVKRSVQKLALLSRGSTGVVLVAVAPVRSEEMSTRWDWLKETLTVGVEQNLGVAPGILLVERERTRSLTDERQVTAGLPAALRASAVFVDSSFKINREKGPDVVTLQLRCRRGGSTLLETAVDGTVSNTVELCRNAAREVATKFGVKAADNSMAAQQEAAMLVAEAQVANHEADVALSSHASSKELERELAAYRRTLALLESALALIPDSCEYQQLLMWAKTPSQLNLDELVTDAQLRFPVANLILRRCPPEKAHYASILRFMWSFFYTARRLLEEHPEARHQEAFTDLTRMYWDLWQAVYEKSPADQEALLQIGQQSYVLCSTVDDAIKISRKYIDSIVAKNPLKPEMNTFYMLKLLDDPIAQPKVIAFMDELMTSTNPAVRFLGLRWGIVIYNAYGVKPDEARAQAIAKEHIELMKSGKFRTLDAWKTAVACTYSADVKVNYEKLARICEDIANYGIQEKIYDAMLAKNTADWLEEAGKGQEAAAFFARYVAEFPPGKGNWSQLQDKLRDLRRRFPDPTTSLQAEAAANEFHTKKLLTFSDFESLRVGTAPQMGLRLFMQGNVAVIVYFYHENSDSGYGVLRYDMDRQKVISDQRAGKNARMEFMDSIFVVLEVASDGRNVFVGHHTEGILVFPSDGPPRLLNEANGLASQKIWRLEASDGKLYAIIGSPYTESGLMEVDWKSGTSRILCSQRSKAADSPLASRDMFGILADGNRHLLWVLVSEADVPGGGHKKVSLFTYSPRDNRVELKQKDFTFGSNYSMRWTEGGLLFWGNAHCKMFNPDSSVGETIYGDYSKTFPYRQQTQPKNTYWQMPPGKLGPRRSFTFIGNDLLALQDQELLWFHNGVAEPEYMLNRLVTKEVARRIYFTDLALTKQGMLMLSLDGLYLVPEIKAPTQPAAQSTLAK